MTAAGIARLAGVGRAAVSNWRRRHADFPKPVGGTETSPSFALAEVEAWLRHQGKLAEVPLRERVWQQLAGHPQGPVTALTHAGCGLLLIHDRPTVWLEVSAGSDERLAAMLPGALEQVLVPRFGALRSGRGGGVRGVHTPSGVNSPDSMNGSGVVNTGETAHASAGSARRHSAKPVHGPTPVHGPAPVHSPTPVHSPPAVNTSPVANSGADVNTPGRPAGELDTGTAAPAPHT
ncbi:restriction endonuclease subunit M, partial [Streptomyces resistomycificus]